ncbi:MAG: type IV secretory system conjugative DNA transfer family protein [Hyphomicrobium sp.]|jgi:type IV secretion system protein VirD4
MVDRNQQKPQQAHQQQPTTLQSYTPSILWQVIILAALTWAFVEGHLPHFFPEDWHPAVLAVAGTIATFCGVNIAAKLVTLYHRVSVMVQAATPQTVHGSARFADMSDIKKARLHSNNGLWIGLFGDQVLRFENETHTLVISPAGGGKTVYLVVPQLALVTLPMLVTDMKGELPAITARWRAQRMGHRVRVLNPPSVWRQPSDTYNPCDIVLEDLVTDPRDAILDAKSIALQLIPEPTRAGADNNQFFRQGARDIVSFTILALALRYPGSCHLPEAQKIVTNPIAFRNLCEEIKDAHGGVEGDVANMAQQHIAASDATPREFQSFMNNAVQALGPFAPSGRIAEFCKTSSFRFRELKTGDADGKPVTVYNCCDMTRLAQFAPWTGLLNWAAMTELQRCQVRQQVLILMDEASNFTIADLPKYLTALRGYGISVFLVFQEHSEIERAYGKEAAATFWSQSDLIIGFGIKSQETAERFSKLAGVRTIEARNFNLGGQAGDTINQSQSYTKRELITPDEVRAREEGDMLVFIKNMPLIKAERCGYHEIEPLRSNLDPNPLHGNQPYLGTTRVSL